MDGKDNEGKLWTASVKGWEKSRELCIQERAAPNTRRIGRHGVLFVSLWESCRVLAESIGMVVKPEGASTRNTMKYV